MIQKLRKKFIIINMSIVMLVVTAVLFILCFSSYRRYQFESAAALRRSLSDEQETPPPNWGMKPKEENGPFTFTSTFVVELKADNSYALLRQNGSEVTDSLVQEAVSQALTSSKSTGTLNALALRYQIETTSQGRRIAFADTSHETDSMQNLILTSLLVLAGSMLLLFIISYFLARWALKPVEKAWAQQNQFIADASHELKTPLTVILANLKILLSHGEDTIATQERWLKNTHSEATRMKKLVENLLFLARSEANTMPLSKKQILLSDTIWNCLLPFEPLAFEQGITLQEDIAADIQVFADEGQVKQLLAILLDNACKYAGREKLVTVTLTQVKDMACITVNNTGDPIPPEALPHLFERFYRSDKSRARKMGGYGLGLSIALTIVHTHHGQLTVTSNATDGTTFSAFLPISPHRKRIPAK